MAKQNDNTSEPEKTLGKAAAEANESVNGAVDAATETAEEVVDDVNEAAEEAGELRQHPAVMVGQVGIGHALDDTAPRGAVVLGNAIVGACQGDDR